MEKPMIIEAALAAVLIAEPRPVWNETNLKAYVRQHTNRQGWGNGQWSCLDTLIHHESRWNHRAQNPTSGAAGLFQRIDGDPMDSVENQVEWGIGYVKHRYGKPCDALRFFRTNNWY